MSWSEFHQQSERCAERAERSFAEGDQERSHSIFSEAARLEELALAQVSPEKMRTLGIVAVSAVSLWFKSAQLKEAERLALDVLVKLKLPPFATTELRLLLQAIWTEDAKQESGVSFIPGQVVVSVRGGEVIHGGAPLDLIVTKVQTIQSLFYRTIEFMNKIPWRERGMPGKDIQAACRPWLFQAPPGSYQFSVAVQEPPQKDFFRPDFRPAHVASKFLQIVKAAGEEGNALAAVVDDRQYRTTFLKLSRNLAPSGKVFESIELRAAGESSGISLHPMNRKAIVQNLRTETPSQPDQQTQIFTGVLRAVHLDKDWLDIAVPGQKPIHVTGLRDAIDDVIGPMVNRSVIVQAITHQRGLRFVDIELDE